MSEFPKSEAETIKAFSTALLIVFFPKNKTSSFERAINFAKSGHAFFAIKEDGVETNVAVFMSEKDQVQAAHELMKVAGGWKNVRMYAGGRFAVAPRKVSDVLGCYLTSLLIPDYKAHCNILQGDLSTGSHNLLLPCRMTAGFRNAPQHPSSTADRYYAHAVTAGCEWCPNFKADDLEILAEGETVKRRRLQVAIGLQNIIDIESKKKKD